MKYIDIKAPAKINIGLNIVDKREDGYHNLETFFYPICDLYDKLTFELSNEFSFSQTQDASIKYQEKINSNLVVKAKELMEKVTGKKLNVNIKLRKNIPIGAGLGGGSSDAAATLISLNELFRLNIRYDKLIELALTLGSDVPFFLKAKPSTGKSRGEILTIKEFDLPYYILIVNPNIHVSTKEAFQNISPKNPSIDYEKVFNSVESFLSNKNEIVNDFEEYVFLKYPAVKEIKDRLIDIGSEFTSMSGSGSSVYGFFKSKELVVDIKTKFPDDYFIFISSPGQII